MGRGWFLEVDLEVDLEVGRGWAVCVGGRSKLGVLVLGWRRVKTR